MLQFTWASAGLILTAALLGGAAGAGAIWLLVEPSQSASPGTNTGKRADSRGEGFAGDAHDLALRIDRLEAELKAVRQRASSTEALSRYARVLDQNEDGAASTDGKAGAELPGVIDAEDPSFELAVRTVMDRVDWEREEERRVTQEKRREERAQRQTDLLAQRLKLNDAQKQKLQLILSEQMETFRNLRSEDAASAPRPTSRAEWRTRITEIRAETEQKLQSVLDEGQMTAYRQFVEEEGFGWRGGRGGPRRQGQRE